LCTEGGVTGEMDRINWADSETDYTERGVTGEMDRII
jgi:hypothetical protein